MIFQMKAMQSVLVTDQRLRKKQKPDASIQSSFKSIHGKFDMPSYAVKVTYGWQKGDGRRKTGDGRRKTEDGRRETGDLLAQGSSLHRQSAVTAGGAGLRAPSFAALQLATEGGAGRRAD